MSNPAKPPEEHEDISQVTVRLRPIIGIKPGVYLTYIYGLAVAAALFFLLFFPGMQKRGTLYSFAALPDGAAVFVDGKYAGATPVKSFLPKGKHEITIQLPFYLT